MPLGNATEVSLCWGGGRRPNQHPCKICHFIRAGNCSLLHLKKEFIILHDTLLRINITSKGVFILAVGNCSGSSPSYSVAETKLESVTP